MLFPITDTFSLIFLFSRIKVSFLLYLFSVFGFILANSHLKYPLIKYIFINATVFDKIFETISQFRKIYLFLSKIENPVIKF